MLFTIVLNIKKLFLLRKIEFSSYNVFSFIERGVTEHF